MSNVKRRSVDPLVDDLAVARRRANISARDLAEQINVHPSTILKCESGRSGPSLTILVRWVKALGYELVLEKW